MCCKESDPGGPACSKADCRLRCGHSLIVFSSFNIILQAFLVGYNYHFITLWNYVCSISDKT